VAPSVKWTTTKGPKHPRKVLKQLHIFSAQIERFVAELLFETGTTSAASPLQNDSG